MGRPKLSLIIPVYNKAPFLRRCLDSVARQLRDDVEVIVVDDGSSDGSKEIIMEYPLFIKALFETNGGASKARNYGIKESKGKAIAFLDADDALEPEALETMAAYADRVDKWPIIQFGHRLIRDYDWPTICMADKGAYSLSELPKYWQMVWNKVYSSELIKGHNIEFNEGMTFGEDEIFNVDCLMAAGKLWHGAHLLVQHWIDDKNSICRGGKLKAKDAQKLDKGLYDRIQSSQSREVKDWLYGRLGQIHNSKMFKQMGFTTKGMGKHDIVYLLKDTRVNEELRYSLRSVDENFYHRNVWFAGGCPEGLKPDGHMDIKQDAPSKWENVRNMLVEICKNDKISKQFWLFNDDFFVMKTTGDELQQFYNGTLQEQIYRCEEREGGRTDYTNRLRHLVETLKTSGLTTLNYSVHKPMLVDRELAMKVLVKYPSEPMFRALYGNYWRIGGVDRKDCKIRRVDREINPARQFISTQDDSFSYGIVGMQLRGRFIKPSRFEV